jgi:hypothetical protein
MRNDQHLMKGNKLGTQPPKYRYAVVFKRDDASLWELECSSDNYYTTERMYKNVVGWGIYVHVQMIDNETGEVVQDNGCNMIPARPGEPVTEMYICEVPHLFLHVNQLYIFRVHPECDECKALALHTPKEQS